MYIENIDNPEDLKKLDISELNALSNEIRKILLNKMSITGGHVGSNFGMIETTIALHYVFNSPIDKFVFDVSHQCYTHKILTGRKEAYIDPEKYMDVTGYTNPEESEHDFFNIGHTSTSISLACGLAKERDLKGDKENIVAIIGDGSLSGGEAYEGMDCAGELNSNLIIVVNDNQMAIAENHGALYRHLGKLRESKGKAECNIFKALNLDYIFVEDGNNVQELVKTFRRVKDIDHPVVVHICTVKGHGYKYAEMNKEDWHWRRAFNIENGQIKTNYLAGENIDNIAREHILDRMKDDKNISIVVAAVPRSIGLIESKRKEAGNQFIDVGIAEEHAITMCAGLAKNGGKPIFVTDCTFYQRAYDQISQELCINNCAATLLVRNASVWGLNDKTHLGIFDIPLFSHIPNLVYLAPTNVEEYIAMIDWSIDQNKYPVAIRIPKNGVNHYNKAVQKNYDNLNKYKVETMGKDVAIIALGDFFQLGEEIVSELLKNNEINATLINPRYITGIDEDLLDELKKNHKLVITLEDGIIDGGFGQKIAGYYGNSEMKVLNYGLKKEFIDRYNPELIMKENRLTSNDIISDINMYL